MPRMVIMMEKQTPRITALWLLTQTRLTLIMMAKETFVTIAPDDIIQSRLMVMEVVTARCVIMMEKQSPSITSLSLITQTRLTLIMMSKETFVTIAPEDIIQTRLMVMEMV